MKHRTGDRDTNPAPGERQTTRKTKDEMMTTATEPTMADRINRHLECGGVVQVTTYTKSWLYTQKHAGCFSMIDGSLHVRHGRGKNQLSNGDKLLVSIRFGQYEN